MRKFKAIPGKGITASIDISGISKQTPEEAFEEMSDMFDDVDEFCYAYYEMPSEDIKYIYSIHDGTNEDDCVETTDGSYYMCYSGGGVEKVTRDEMIRHFSY